MTGRLQNLILSLIVYMMVALVWVGCNRSPKDQAPTSPAEERTSQAQSDENTEPVAEDDPKSSNSSEPQITSSRIDVKPSKVAIAAPNSNSQRVGPGHFNGGRETLIYHFPPVRLLEMSPDGRFAVVVYKTGMEKSLIQTWDIPGTQLINETYEPYEVTSLSIAPEGELLAYGRSDRSVVLQPLPKGESRRLRRHRLSVGGLDFSPTGKQLASLGHDNQLLIWDTDSGRVISQIENGDERYASEVQFVAPDRLWTREGNQSIRWFSFTNSKLAFKNEVKLSEDFGLFTSDEKHLYVRNQDQSVRIIDVSTGESRTSSQFSTTKESDSFGLTHQMTAGAIARGPQKLTVATDSGLVAFWSHENGDQKTVAKVGEHISAIATDQSGSRWIAATLDGGLCLLDSENPGTVDWLHRKPPGSPAIAPRFNRDARTVLSMRGGNTINAVEIESGRVQHTFELPQREESEEPKTVTTVLQGQNGQLYVGTNTGTVEILSEEPGRQFVESKSAITALAEAPNGHLLLAGDDQGQVTWRDVHQTSEPTVRSEQTGRINSATFSPDGQWAATASEDHTIVIWDVVSRSQHHTLNSHSEAVQTIVFSPDSQWLISGDRKGQLMLWHVSHGNQVWKTTLRKTLIQPSETRNVGRFATSPYNFVKPVRTDHGIAAVAISEDQRVLAVGTTTGYLQTFDLLHFRELSSVYVREHVSDLMFSLDQTSLLVATTSGNVLRYWCAPEPPRMLAGHDGNVRFAALDAAGMRAVSGGHDEQLCVWDVEKKELLGSIENGEAITVGALSPDGHHAVTAGFGSGIVFWDLDQMVRLEKRYRHQARIWALTFSRDGKKVASGSEDKSVKIWDIETRKATLTIPHDKSVRFVKFSTNGKLLVTSTIDERGWKYPARLQLWNAVTGSMVLEFKGHSAAVNGAVFSEDASQLTSLGADGQICRWDVSTGKQLDNELRRSGVSHPGLIRNGQLLVMRRHGNGIFIDDAKSLKRLSAFSVPTQTIGDLNVSAQGERMIAGTSEGRIYVWRIDHE